MKNVLHVVPTTLPGRCGVGDYAVRLAGAISRFGIRSVFLGVGHEHFATHRESPDLPDTALLTTNEPFEVLRVSRLMKPDTILLHLSPFGYHPDAYPHWLLIYLKQLRSFNRLRIGIVFHEIWQSPALFSRRIYKSILQRHLLSKIAKCADFFVTNTAERCRKIKSIATDVPGYSFPVFSNVGESTFLPENKHDVAVVFGSIRQRMLCWAALSEAQAEILKLPVTKILDIGPGIATIPRSLRDQVEVKGLLPLAEVDGILSEAKIGILSYDSLELAKSGIFAAYAAHGNAALNLGRMSNFSDGLSEKHFVQLDECSSQAVETSRRNLWHWYQGHTLNEVADFLALQVNGH
ncbi:hypothetical protein ACRBEV_05840 [Methylobacterium phyllosphaerae]